MCGCAENRAFVFLQHLEPVPEIGGVIVTDFRGNAEVRAQKRRSQFRNKFLAGVTVIAEPLGVEAAVKTALGARPVRLMPISA